MSNVLLTTIIMTYCIVRTKSNYMFFFLFLTIQIYTRIKIIVLNNVDRKKERCHQRKYIERIRYIYNSKIVEGTQCDWKKMKHAVFFLFETHTLYLMIYIDGNDDEQANENKENVRHVSICFVIITRWWFLPAVLYSLISFILF